MQWRLTLVSSFYGIETKATKTICCERVAADAQLIKLASDDDRPLLHSG